VAVEVKPMEVKKQQLTTEVSKQTYDAPVTSRKAQSFLSDVKGELQKISWTTPDELKAYTKIVIAATFAFGIGVYLVDIFIQMFLGALESTIKLIGG